MKPNQLILGSIQRLGAPDRTPSETIDFIIDGESLYKMLRAGERDSVGLFSRGWDNEKSAKEYKLEAKSDLDDGRILVFGCAECLDIGCGGFTMKIEFDGENFIWSDFAFENNYDDSMTERECYGSVGPFIFSKDAYLEMIEAAKK